MRQLLHSLLALLAAFTPVLAWNTEPHQKITRAAIDTLPPLLLAPIASESDALVEIYCLYPDRYLEMERFGFVRKSPGPRTAEEIRLFCVRPDGVDLHSASFVREQDLASLVFLFERIAASLAAKRPADTARYVGTLSHFIADSLSPPHSVPAEDLPPNVHPVIERSLPAFTLGSRPPRVAGTRITAAAGVILDRLYAAAGQNRKDLPLIVAAARAGDQPALDVYRLRAGTAAAEILADSLCTLLTISVTR